MAPKYVGVVGDMMEKMGGTGVEKRVAPRMAT